MTTDPLADLPDLPDLSRYRSEFPITERYAFFNHSGVSAPNRRVSEAVRAHLDTVTHEPIPHYINSLIAVQHELCQRSAELLNARSPDEIVPMPNTAAGINTAALSLPLRAGDNVLVLDGDYPANVYPWQNLAYRGILTKVVPQRAGGLDLNVLEQRIDNRTRVIALSTVMFATGFRNDIAAVGQLCHERGIFFVVDAIQSLGAFPIDVQACHIDFLACGAQKWLMSLPGCGLLYCRGDLLDQLQPGAYVGASSVVDPMNYLDYNLTFPPTASRFNLGIPNWSGMVALNAAIAVLQEVGVQRISEQILQLVDVLLRDLKARGYRVAASDAPAHRSGIVVAQVADAAELCKRFEQDGVIVTPRGGGVRVAPHFYNTSAELLRVGELLDAYGAQRT
jgi:selenocysteine lyase/cysteine desulfurase